MQASVREADLFIGTSAGSIVGAQIATAIPLEDLFRRQQADPKQQIDERLPPVDFARWRTDVMRAREA